MTKDVAGLTVAVTGPTGTFGFGLVPLLEADERISRVIGIARRPFDPADHGWSKMTYRQGDVRDQPALESVFTDADVVVHLAFLVTASSSNPDTRAINIDGTLNTFRAAARAGARRFVYASSVAAYGFHADNPDALTEDDPTRPAERLFYAQEKAELEQLLETESAAHPSMDLYVLRPPIVLGPHAVGGKVPLPPAVETMARRAVGAFGRLRLPIPAPLPPFPLQFIHEDDVGQAFLLCIVGAGPAGSYNIAGPGPLTAHDVARELGVIPLPLPLGLAQRAARVVSRLPWPPLGPPVTEWADSLTHPSIMDTSKAEQELGWRPRYSGIEALRATLHPPASAD